MNQEQRRFLKNRISTVRVSKWSINLEPEPKNIKSIRAQIKKLESAVEEWNKKNQQSRDDKYLVLERLEVAAMQSVLFGGDEEAVSAVEKHEKACLALKSEKK